MRGFLFSRMNGIRDLARLMNEEELGSLGVINPIRFLVSMKLGLD